MRKILFRGKSNFNGEWIYGVPVPVYINSYYDNRIEMTEYQNYDTDYAYEQFSKAEEVLPETIGQYTGVDDCTGRKIFEGDLVKGFDSYTGEMYQDVTGIVKFYKGSFGAEWNNCFEPFSITDDEIIVIGNIHDNPELMKGK